MALLLAEGARPLAALALAAWLALELAMMARAQDDCPLKCDCERTGVGILVNCSARNLTAFPTIPANISELVLELDVSHNAIRRLPSSTPALPLVRVLSLADNELSALPGRWLRRVPALLRLDLAGNPALTLLGLGESGLTHARSLQLLNMSRCAAVDDLAGAEVALVSNSLEVKRAVFVGIDIDVTVIVVTVLLLSVVIVGIFIAVVIVIFAVIVLDLSRCSLPEATGKLVAGFPSLRRLDLSHNPLNLLQGLNSSTLQELYLVHTGLDSIHPAALLDLPSLTELDVSGNRGFAFPERGVLSASLTGLRARFCELRLHNLKAFPNLRYANLQGNGIQGVWNTSFANEHLIELDLSNNNIHRVHPDAFGHLPRLLKVSLANNKIMSIHPDVFVKNAFLAEVNLSSNTLTDLGQMKAEAVTTLDVSQCNVDKLTIDSLEGMPNLRILDLSSNRLEYVPDNLTSDSLQWLDLSFCRLAAVGNDTFRRLPSLLVLNLSGNRFTEPFRKHAFSHNKRLRALRLADNPWRCDCASHDFLDFAEFTFTVDQKEAMERARCASPEAVQGQSWLEACYDVWYPPLDEREPVRRFGVAMLAVAAVAGGTLVLLSALRQAVQKRRKEAERRRQEEMERRLEVRVRPSLNKRLSVRSLGLYVYERERELREQIRLELDDEDIFRSPRSRPQRTPSEITQPPTYEEALLLSRSQQDLLDQRTAAAAAEGSATPDSVAHTPATCARHLIYEVEVEAAPKSRPAKPPRKTGKRPPAHVASEPGRGRVERGRSAGGSAAQRARCRGAAGGDADCDRGGGGQRRHAPRGQPDEQRSVFARARPAPTPVATQRLQQRRQRRGQRRAPRAAARLQIADRPSSQRSVQQSEFQDELTEAQ
ncbi:Toll-like receptor 6 [Gryllus bimaculatus]|nr:Toll-like receptor 6 [Gryllus bimaculatus]